MKSTWRKTLVVVAVVTALAVPAVILRAAPADGKREKHPAIHRAIKGLEEAKVYLEHADHDFGGHRKQALEDCERAVVQLRLALQTDRK